MASSADFWAKQLGGRQQPPPHIQQAPAGPQSAGAWWQPTPVSGHLQVAIPAQDPGMQPGEWTYEYLKSLNASEMNQDQMEALAEFELQSDKYNQVCPQCGSTNFIPQGTKVSTGTGTIRMGTDKCFECGASSSTLTSSPEPATGGRGGKPGRATQQTAHGGQSGQGSYGRHHSQLPAQYQPRGN